MLLNTVQSKRIDAKQLITHHFKLGEILKAYDTFGKAADTKVLKVIVEAPFPWFIYACSRRIYYLRRC
jgi:alcohol dehydrogenase